MYFFFFWYCIVSWAVSIRFSNVLTFFRNISKYNSMVLQGHAPVADAWNEAKLAWSDFLPTSVDESEFIAKEVSR